MEAQKGNVLCLAAPLRSPIPEPPSRIGPLRRSPDGGGLVVVRTRRRRPRAHRPPRGHAARGDVRSWGGAGRARRGRSRLLRLRDDAARAPAVSRPGSRAGDTGPGDRPQHRSVSDRPRRSRRGGAGGGAPRGPQPGRGPAGRAPAPGDGHLRRIPDAPSALRLERPARAAGGPLEIHPGAPTGAVRPAGSGGRGTGRGPPPPMRCAPSPRARRAERPAPPPDAAGAVPRLVGQSGAMLGGGTSAAFRAADPKQAEDYKSQPAHAGADALRERLGDRVCKPSDCITASR